MKANERQHRVMENLGNQQYLKWSGEPRVCELFSTEPRRTQTVEIHTDSVGHFELIWTFSKNDVSRVKNSIISGNTTSTSFRSSATFTQKDLIIASCFKNGTKFSLFALFCFFANEHPSLGTGE